MSLNEKKRNKHLADIFLTEGISRSKSFAGLSHRRTNSTDAKFSCLGAEGNFENYVFPSGLSSSVGRNFIHAFSPKSLKPPKAPLPERTQSIFDAISKGLKDSILLAQNDISNSRTAIDSVSVSSTLQSKTTERYLKRLEFHLSKLEELKEQYDVQQKMRDGIRTMAYAYILSPGKEKEMALNSVRSEFKECTELMCCFENTLQSLMGTFLFEMKGIQGFARICCGDIFDVVIKHGEQKWKSRGRVIKNGQQLWENKVVLFKGLFNEPLYIKASEVKGLGKNVVLGNKYCETLDLFSAHPQQMTVNLNPSGSLKLKLVITWNPLHNIADGINISSLPCSSGTSFTYAHSSITQSSKREIDDFSEFSLSTKEGLPYRINVPDDMPEFSSGSTSASAQSSAIASPDMDIVRTYSNDACLIESDYFATHDTSTMPTSQQPLQGSNFSDSQIWSVIQSEDSSECCSVDMRSSSAHSQFSGHTLTEVLKKLLSTLEDYSGKYSEVADLSQKVTEISKILEEKRCNTSDSNISVSIESALGCFDFLNTAIENADIESIDEKFEEKASEHDSSYDDKQVLNNDEQYTFINDSNMLYLTTGIDQLDAVLTFHLLYCTKIITQLVACGSLKCLEIFFLDKIRRQTLYINSLLKFLQKPNSELQIDNFFEENEVEIFQLWFSIAGNSISISADHLCSEVEKLVRSKSALDSHVTNLIATRITCHILDVAHFDNDAVISVFQFKDFVLNYNGNFSSVILEFVTDALAFDDLKSHEVEKVLSAVTILSKIYPSSYSLSEIGSLLIDENVNLKNLAEYYLKDISENPCKKEKAILFFVEGLESENVSTRISSCTALGVLNAKNCSEQLSYILHEDENVTARNIAKNILSGFDEELAPDTFDKL